MTEQTNRGLSRRQFLAGAASGAALSAAGLVTGARAISGADADLIVVNARVTTMDPAQPEASAFAVGGGRFLHVGDEATARALAGPLTTVVDARGRRVIPGLIDSHTHFIRGGMNYNLELRWDNVDSLEEGLDMVRRQAEVTPEGQWIRVVGGFSEFQFKEKRLPTVAELDAVAPRHPVLVHYLYKLSLLNSAAIRAVGYDRPDAPVYPGGRIEREADGTATGRLLAEPSGLLLYRTLLEAPRLGLEDQVNSCLRFMDEVASLGVTSVSDAGGGGMSYPDSYGLIHYLHRQGLLSLRIGYHTFPQVKGQELADYRRWVEMVRPGEGDDMLKLVGAGENICWASYDYEIFGKPRPEIDRDAEAIQGEILTLLGERGWPFRQHITYDETGDRLLRVYEEVARGAGLTPGWFVDHAETFGPRNLERIAELGGGVAIQNRLQFQAEDFVDQYGMERLRRTPDFRRLYDLGIPLGGGTDATRVTSYNPWFSIQWMSAGLSRGGLQMYDEATLLSRHEALEVWTTGSAWFTGDAGRKGAIAEGQLADFAILDRDYFTVTDAEIANIRASLTAVGGRIVQARDAFAALDWHRPPPVSPEWSPLNTFAGRPQA